MVSKFALHFFACGEVGAVRVMENEGADASFGLHHHAFSQFYSDLFGEEKLP